jgi:hypothetical protein
MQAYCLECPVPGGERQPEKGELTTLARIGRLVGLF